MATLEQFFLDCRKHLKWLTSSFKSCSWATTNQNWMGHIANCQLPHMTLHEPSDSHLSSGDWLRRNLLADSLGRMQVGVTRPPALHWYLKCGRLDWCSHANHRQVLLRAGGKMPKQVHRTATYSFILAHPGGVCFASTIFTRFIAGGFCRSRSQLSLQLIQRAVFLNPIQSANPETWLLRSSGSRSDNCRWLKQHSRKRTNFPYIGKLSESVSRCPLNQNQQVTNTPRKPDGGAYHAPKNTLPLSLKGIGCQSTGSRSCSPVCSSRVRKQ